MWLTALTGSEPLYMRSQPLDRGRNQESETPWKTNVPLKHKEKAGSRNVLCICNLFAFPFFSFSLVSLVDHLLCASLPQLRPLSIKEHLSKARPYGKCMKRSGRPPACKGDKNTLGRYGKYTGNTQEQSEPPLVCLMSCENLKSHPLPQMGCWCGEKEHGLASAPAQPVVQMLLSRTQNACGTCGIALGTIIKMFSPM